MIASGALDNPHILQGLNLLESASSIQVALETWGNLRDGQLNPMASVTTYVSGQCN